MHNFFVQCFDKNGEELTDMRSSSYEFDLQVGLESLLKRGIDTERAAAIFVSTVDGFEPVGDRQLSAGENMTGSQIIHAALTGDKTDVSALVKYAGHLEAEIKRLRQDRGDCQMVMDGQQAEIEKLRAENIKVSCHCADLIEEMRQRGAFQTKQSPPSLISSHQKRCKHDA